MTSQITIRRLTSADERAVAQVMGSSAWTAIHFSPEELPDLLASRPAYGVFSEAAPRLRAFLVASSLVAPAAWLGGFGVPWEERQRAFTRLDALLPPWLADLRAQGARTVYYAGHDQDNDWLFAPLSARGFQPYGALRSYDKLGTASPTEGNRDVTIRPVDLERDLDTLLQIEAVAFDPPWRHDECEFREAAAMYPFFIVATTPEGHIVGYQYSVAEGDLGFLVRVAVHPSAHRRGIGARLMAEAMRYFTQAGVARVLLNAEETNSHAHRLYEWFGFTQAPQRGFVLARSLDL